MEAVIWETPWLEAGGASCGSAVCYFTQKLDATLAEDKSHTDIYFLGTTFVPGDKDTQRRHTLLFWDTCNSKTGEQTAASR